MREGSRMICSGGAKKAAKGCNGYERVGDHYAHENKEEDEQDLHEKT